jgi:hypothetical protein
MIMADTVIASHTLRFLSTPPSLRPSAPPALLRSLSELSLSLLVKVSVTIALSCPQ